MKRIISAFLAVVLILSMSSVCFAASDEAVKAADELYALGLFQGKDVDADGKPIYALDDVPTRHEAVTMLVRLLGKEAEAKAGNWKTPFTDVADWAKPYVGYAYANGLTSGDSDTTFGGNRTVTAAQYLTFVLRALGYSSDTDFKWDKAWELTDKLGITDGEYPSDTFLRGDIAKISRDSLSQKLKGQETTLWESIQARQDKVDAQAPAEQPESTKPIVSEPVDPTWPYFEIDGVKCLAAHNYVAKPGTYNVKLFVDGAQVMRYEEFVVADSSVCSAADNGNGTFTLTLKSDGQTDIRVHWFPGDSENGRRSDLGITCYTDTLTDEPGISLWWHGGTIKDGFGFGVNGQRIFVADVLLDGVRQSDYTVTCDDGKCVCSVQADGSLLIEKPAGGESRITVTCGDLSARFGIMS